MFVCVCLLIAAAAILDLNALLLIPLFVRLLFSLFLHSVYYFSLSLSLAFSSIYRLNIFSACVYLFAFWCCFCFCTQYMHMATIQ